MPRFSTAGLSRLPGGIWALGLTSMFMDISSELIHSLLPIFMASVLKTSMTTIGLIEGMAESTASVTKVFSGTLSDRWGKRKPLAVLGYGLAALTKPVFPLASSIGWVAAARFADRVGKGIRGAPRDALIADITPAADRGAAYGLRQALDTVGALLGPALALAFMWLLHDDMRSVLWIASAPALVSVIILIAGVREPEHVTRNSKAVSFSQVRALGRNFALIVVLGTVFTLARFSEAFLVLRAQSTGLHIAYVPVVMVVMNAVYTLGAYPAGAASDRGNQKALLLSGMGVLIASDLVLAAAPSTAYVLVGSALWGLHMALTQGLFSKLVADTAPAELRGTAFGIFNLVTGIAALFASLIAGALWSSVGPPATFAVGAVFASVAAVGQMVYRARH